MKNKERKQFNVRLEVESKKILEEIAEIESKKLGYDVKMSDVVRRALNEFINNYKRK